MIIKWNNEVLFEEGLKDKSTLRAFQINKIDDGNEIKFVLLDSDGLWGFGERFDSLNQVGLSRDNLVYEKFTDQGNNTYLPVPFMISNHIGLYVDTYEKLVFSSNKIVDGIQVSIIAATTVDQIRIFEGAPKYQIGEFLKLVGVANLPPMWGFGPWMSANRWNTQEEVLKQAGIAKELDLYHSVIVVEAWSDEATFYEFNENKLWPSPKKMVDELHDNDLKLLLWQIPVFKKLDPGQKNKTQNQDCKNAIEKNYVVLNKDGTPYQIPDGRWFEGSMIPDFTNPETFDWWFEKRKPLLDIGVDGFKTDGGEFVYTDDVKFHDGSTGKTMRNGYSYLYTAAYKKAIGENRVLFSRAGYTGSWKNSLIWGGDQMSNWSELRHVLIAGLNASMSGVFYWGFDIAGFAGAMPSKELYLRSFALATFVPIMQWHSEPLGGQFKELFKSDDVFNDRSPWNMASYYNDESILDISRKYCKLRKLLMPYIYGEAQFSVENRIPLMQALFIKYPDDENTFDIDDEYLFGRNLLIAPILEEGRFEREVYLPKGTWYDCTSKKAIKGKIRINRKYDIDQIGIFINLECDNKLLKDIFEL
jgi:alpha-D-xyloside xylohydrolase